MGLKTSGKTMQSFNNSSRRCAHASAIFSPPGFALPKLGVSREAIVFTTCYVRQWEANAEHTVGVSLRGRALLGMTKFLHHEKCVQGNTQDPWCYDAITL